MSSAITRLKTQDELVADELRDEKFRKEWERLAVARAVAATVIAYRADRGLSQRDLARVLGFSQPQVARIETGEHAPSWSTLMRLAGRLDLEFTISITAADREPTLLFTRGRESVVAQYDSDQSALRFTAAGGVSAT